MLNNYLYFIILYYSRDRSYSASLTVLKSGVAWCLAVSLILIFACVFRVNSIYLFYDCCWPAGIYC